jgi:glycosyltransferase involved in cell wall biosynthesis
MTVRGDSRKFTDKVYLREFDNFSAQKNYGLSKASFDWILSIDADERVSGGLRKEIEEIVKGPFNRRECVFC